jgi:hypothetical protein
LPLYDIRVLVPPPQDLAVSDNLGSRKGKAIRRAIRAAGAKLFLSKILARPQPDRSFGGLRKSSPS